MDKYFKSPKKRRSSIKRIFNKKEDDNTAVDNIGSRSKRRISFSGKKLVREFSGAEEAKTWTNSYEVSDHTDGSLGMCGTGTSETQKVPVDRKLSFLRPDDKENINYQPHILATGTIPKYTNIPPTGTVRSSLSNTMDFIDHYQHNNSLRLEHSIEITLLGQEGVTNNFPLRGSTIGGLCMNPSFSLEENEMIHWPAPVERTVDFMQELRGYQNYEPTRQNKSLSNKQCAGDKTTRKTNETMLGNLQSVDLDETIANDVEALKGWNAKTHNTNIANQAIDFECEASEAKLLSRKSILQTQDMDISLSLEKTTLNKTENQKELQQSVMETPNRFFSKLDEISIQVESDTSANLEQEMRQFFQNSIDGQHGGVPMDVSLPYVTEAEKTNEKRQTIVFAEDDAIEEEHLPQKKPAEFAINCESKVPVAITPKVLVRKIFAPIVGSTNIVATDAKQQTIERYKRKQEEQKVMPISQSSGANSTAERFVSAGTKNARGKPSTKFPIDVLTTEFSSPLLSPEYLAGGQNHELNLRQLCDAIGEGKIQVFPSASKPTLSSRKARNAASRAFVSIEAVLETEPTLSDEQTSIVESKQVEANAECSRNNTAATNNSCKRELRYFDTDDMMLDNTSFLTKAKLGDETASRNSSKCSNSQRRETIHFHSEIDETIVPEPQNKSEEELEVISESQNKPEEELEKIVPESQKNPKKESNRLLQTNKQSGSIGSHTPLMRTEYESPGLQKKLNASAEDLFEVTLEDCNISATNATAEVQALVESKTRRQTMHLREDIQGDDCEDLKSMQPNTNMRHQTMHKRENMEFESKKSTRMQSKSDTRRQTQHLGEDIEVEVDTKGDVTSMLPKHNLTHRPGRQTLLLRENMDLEVCEDVDQNREYIQKKQQSKLKPKRPTLYLQEYIHTEADESPTLKSKDFATDIAKGENKMLIPIQKQAKKRHTLYFTQDNNISVEETDDNISTKTSNNTIKRLQTTSEIQMEDSLENKLKELRLKSLRASTDKVVVTNANAAFCASPAPNPEMRERMRRLYEGTPHRSFIEFEQLEHQAYLDQQKFDEDTASKAKKESAVNARNHKRRQTTHKPVDIQLDVSGVQPLRGYDIQLPMSPILSSVTQKRLTSNLTPNLPLSKKRQTHVFTDCKMDESPLQKRIVGYAQDSDLNKQKTMLWTENMLLDEYTKAFEEGTVPLQARNDTHTVRLFNNTTAMDISIECEDKLVAASEKSPNVRSTPQSLTMQPVDVEPLVRACRTPSRIPMPLRNAKTSPNNKNIFNLDHSLETIQMPRRVTFTQRKDSNLPSLHTAPENETIDELIKQPPQGIGSAFDENTITISDVSVYYLAERQSQGHSLKCNNAVSKRNGEQTLNTIEEPLRRVHAAEESAVAKKEILPQQQIIDLCDDTTLHVMAKYKNNFINLSDNVMTELADFENTRLSLVETLIDNDDDELEVICDDPEDENDYAKCCEHVDVPSEHQRDNKVYSVALSHAAAHTAAPTTVQLQASVGVGTTFSVNTPVSCKGCQGVLLNETTSSTTVDSFMLPSVPPKPTISMKRLRQLRKRPTLAEVHEYYRRVELEHSSSEDEEQETEEVSHDEIDILEKKLEEDLRRLEKKLVEQHLKNPIVVRKSFVQRLDVLLRERSPNWIFNYQMQSDKYLQFDHRKIITFCLRIHYEETSALGKDIEVRSVEIRRSRVPEKNWMPIDHLMDFQLRLELPFNLQTLCTGSDEFSVCDMLQKVNEICLQVHQLAIKLWSIVCSQQASLVRIDNRIYARKYLRSIIKPANKYPHVEVSEFRVELTNIQKICCKDITAPPLYTFHEDIQYLPMGLDFLQAFLSNPTAHLKSNK